MDVAPGENVLSQVRVEAVMRRAPVSLGSGKTIEEVTRCLIKHKVNAVLIWDEKSRATGVISKTDLMSAYYAGVPLENRAEIIMTHPLFCCAPEETIEAALARMQKNNVHRLYVAGATQGQVVGILTYADVVGFLYRICHRCRRSITRGPTEGENHFFRDRYRVGEVMSPLLPWHRITETLSQVMEGLGVYRRGAVIIKDEADRAVGVLSKTDLILAYRHGVSTESRAEAIMTTPVISCDHDEELSTAIRKMIFSDLHRLFVHREDPANIVGILSLADAARVRSGSCRACVSSRIELDTLQ